MSKNKNHPISSLFLRYGILVLAATSNLYIFYLLLSPLTVFPAYFILGKIYEVSLNGSTIIINGDLPIEIIRACVAGSAYYILLILNLATPKIGFLKRVKMLVLSFGILLVLNITRIVLLSILAVHAESYFEFTHQVFWYLLSTIFVAAIWFFEVQQFEIGQIPFYSDIKMLYSSSRGK